MKWSIKVGRLFGIDVFIHFTFLLLLGFLAYVYWRNTQRIEAAIAGRRGPDSKMTSLQL